MILTGRTQEKLDPVAQEIGDKGGAARTAVCDASDPDFVERLREELDDELI